MMKDLLATSTPGKSTTTVLVQHLPLLKLVFIMLASLDRSVLEMNKQQRVHHTVVCHVSRIQQFTLQ